MNTPTDWVAPIAILAGGLILGLLFVWFFGRRKASAPSIGSDRDLEVKDLVAKRDALIAQLRELDTDSQLAPDQLAQERSRLELETAEVLRALDQYKPGKGGRGAAAPAAAFAETPAIEEPAPASSMNPALKGFLWGTVSVALIATLAWFVTKDSTPRQQDGPMTGGTPAMGAPAQPNPVVLQLEEAVKKSPEDLELRTNLAQAYLESDNLMGVFEQTKYVLERSPEHSRALTFQALVRVAMGEMPVALEMLDKATKSDPKNMDGWLALAWIQTQNDETAKADQTIARAVKESPENKQRIEATYAEMKRVNAQMAQQPGGAPAAGGQMPEGHPPIDGKPAPAQTTTMTPREAAVKASGNAPPIHLTIDIDAAARSRAAKGAALFVIARPAAGQPPIAARRLSAASLPMTIDFSSADSMMGQPLPAQVRIEARLDSDGDAASKSPTDPFAAVDGATAGSSIKLVLK